MFSEVFFAKYFNPPIGGGGRVQGNVRSTVTNISMINDGLFSNHSYLGNLKNLLLFFFLKHLKFFVISFVFIKIRFLAEMALE